ncbi:MAG: hypothetical protein H6713_04740 [Myxococcales bacterium]|nr:hypothetical protein [Myxococcales bacterium]MCB9749299.1 hypothetical protein [Myxococcales bacterium]
MTALRRVLGAPGLWLTIAALKLALAFVLVRPARAVLEASLAPFTITSGRSALLIELTRIIARHEAIAAALVTSLILTAILGVLLWLLVAGAVITRLAARRSLDETLGASLRYLPKIALVTVYSLIPRALVVFNLVVDPLGMENFWARLIVFWLGWTWCTLALDRARAGVVLRGASALDPRPLVGAFLEVVTRRRGLAAAGVMLLGGLTMVATLELGVWYLGAPWVVWAARLLAIVSVGLALWRIAFAVEAALDEGARAPGS